MARPLRGPGGHRGPLWPVPRSLSARVRRLVFDGVQTVQQPRHRDVVHHRRVSPRVIGEPPCAPGITSARSVARICASLPRGWRRRWHRMSRRQQPGRGLFERRPCSQARRTITRISPYNRAVLMTTLSICFSRSVQIPYARHRRRAIPSEPVTAAG
jgi:hypothetical protein